MTTAEAIEKIPGTQVMKADVLGVTQPHIGRLLNGAEPSRLLAYRIAAETGLEVTLDAGHFAFREPPPNGGIYATA